MLKEIINDIRNAGAEQYIGFLILSGLAGLLLAGMITLFTNYEVECYYTKSSIPNDSRELVYSVNARIDWESDVTVYRTFNKEDLYRYLENVKVCGSK